MTCKPAPAKTADKIAVGMVKALEEGNAEAALSLINAYGGDVAAQLRVATTSSERQAIADDALSFLQDRLHLARVIRAHFAARIASLSQGASYASYPEASTTWKMDG